MNANNNEQNVNRFVFRKSWSERSEIAFATMRRSAGDTLE